MYPATLASSLWWESITLSLPRERRNVLSSWPGHFLLSTQRSHHGQIPDRKQQQWRSDNHRSCRLRWDQPLVAVGCQTSRSMMTTSMKPTVLVTLRMRWCQTLKNEDDRFTDSMQRPRRWRVCGELHRWWLGVIGTYGDQHQRRQWACPAGDGVNRCSALGREVQGPEADHPQRACALRKAIEWYGRGQRRDTEETLQHDATPDSNQWLNTRSPSHTPRCPACSCMWAPCITPW